MLTDIQTYAILIAKYGWLLNSKERMTSVSTVTCFLVFKSSQEINYRIDYGNMTTMDMQVIDVKYIGKQIAQVVIQ